MFPEKHIGQHLLSNYGTNITPNSEKNLKFHTFLKKTSNF